MRQYYGDCPNCGGKIILESDGKYYCESCGTAYAQDFNRQEVDAAKKASEPKLQKQAEDLGRKLQQDKAVMQGQSEARKKKEAENWKRGDKISKLLLVGFFGFIIIAFFLIMLLNSVFPAIQLYSSSKGASKEITPLAFNINAVTDLDDIKKDSEKLVLESGDGYELEDAELINIYLATPISTNMDHNCLLLIYKVDGTFGSDDTDSEIYRAVCINNVCKEDNDISSDNLVGDKIVISDTFVDKCFDSEERAFEELVTSVGKEYRVEALNKG